LSLDLKSKSRGGTSIPYLSEKVHEHWHTKMREENKGFAGKGKGPRTSPGKNRRERAATRGGGGNQQNRRVGNELQGWDQPTLLTVLQKRGGKLLILIKGIVVRKESIQKRRRKEKGEGGSFFGMAIGEEKMKRKWEQRTLSFTSGWRKVKGEDVIREKRKP